MQSLTSHSHPDFAGDRRSAETGFIFAVLTGSVRNRPKPTRTGLTAHLADEDRATQKQLLRQLADRALRIFLGREFDDSRNKLMSL